jgi:hypothetical protein
MTTRAPRRLAAAALVAAFALAAACSSGTSSSGGAGAAGQGGYDASSQGGHGGAGFGSACVVRACDSDVSCADCAHGKTRCLVAEHRCIACDPVKGGCAGTEKCTEYGSCVPAGLECPTDASGVPTVKCAENVDCLACDPLHQVCDTVAGACVACTKADPSACLPGELCIAGACTATCPGACTTDDDCANCGPSRACNAGTCSACSPTYACPKGETCAPDGVCVPRCGNDGEGTCGEDADCAACENGATVCHKPDGPVGTCGPDATPTCDHGACEAGTALSPDCDPCAATVCETDAYCCATEWDATCVSEAETGCGCTV